MSNDVSKFIDARLRKRGKIAVAVEVRVPYGIRTKGYVIDLSESGFRMECMSVLHRDQSFFLTVPTFAPLEANIIWRAEYLYGCEFLQPLHTAIFEHMLQKHPVFGRPF
jgi:PilZ domain